MKDKKKKMIITIVGILLVLTVMLGVSYALWIVTKTQEGVNTIETGCLQVELEEENPITLEKAYPLTDEEANGLTPYVFTIKNTCTTKVSYEVQLEMESDTTLASEYVAISVNNGKKKILNTLDAKTPSVKDRIEARNIGRGNIEGNTSRRNEIRIWLDESVTLKDDVQNKKFTSKVVVIASPTTLANVYEESILNGAYPVLADNLIPVEIGSTGVVTKANLENEWYSYEEKRWANAVILEDETKEYKDGEEIPESNIESYFVWIPKYSYQLWDLGNYESLADSLDETKVHTIPIKFGIENTSDSNSNECTTPMTSGSSGNCKIGDYMTPPAFITMGTNGLWVGKFETGYKGATSTETAQSNTSDSTKVQIKPNVYSWRGIQTANAHLVSYNYHRELDSHMMKNTEWGAVAYLQHSKYGSATSVRINNNEAYITGYAAKNEPTCGYTGTSEECNKYESTILGVDGNFTINYKNPSSQVASTTGNYTGIYDMSGGAWDIMLGFTMDKTNSFVLVGAKNETNPGFNGVTYDNIEFTNGIYLPEEKYYDKYKLVLNHNRYDIRILGDGTAEFGPITGDGSSWYKDGITVPSTGNPGFSRGNVFRNSIKSGIFSATFNSTNSASNNGSFRIILAIK